MRFPSPDSMFSNPLASPQSPATCGDQYKIMQMHH
jgi:hypothetical protein